MKLKFNNYIINDIKIHGPSVKKLNLKKQDPKPEIPKGLFRKCGKCKAAVLSSEVAKNNYICPKCNHYFRIPAYERISMIVDPDTFCEFNTNTPVINPISYKNYDKIITGYRKKTDLDEAVVTGTGNISGRKVILCVCDSRFMMASMGRTVGEKITQAVEKATEEALPIIIFASSGGARMQEGIIALMQMAKISAALKRHSDSGLLYVCVLTDPTMGGVTASFGMLGDVILAEPNALIGFAGPRVIEQTIAQQLPESFQRAEFLLEHGFIDQVIERKYLKEKLATVLKLHDSVSMDSSVPDSDLSLEENYNNSSAWDKVNFARHRDRPISVDYIKHLFDDFFEMHGDRNYRDDQSIIGGVGTFLGMPVTIIAQTKGKNTQQNLERNFGMTSPEGYRKALRLIKQAEKFNRPIICFVDTPGGFCGIEAEERGQAEAIARNLFELSTVPVPVLSIVIGEGGSGGALALAVANEVWMLENSIYSVLSPEGFASIVWKDSRMANEAASLMRLTAQDLLDFNVIEKIIPEPLEFSQDNMESVIHTLEVSIRKFMVEYKELSVEEIVNRRYKKFREI